MKERVAVFLVMLVLVLSLGQYASAFSKADVVAMWPFNEGSGTAVGDASGNGHDGAIQGNIVWVQGVFGSALQFPGTDADTWVAVPHDATLTLVTFTVAAWVKLDSTGTSQCILSKVEPRLVENYAAWALPAKAIQVRFSSQGTYYRDNGKTEILDGNWHHIAGTFDSHTLRYYVDGELDIEVPAEATPDSNPGPVLIGAYPGSGIAQQYVIKGLVDEVALFNMALSADEIKSIMDDGLLGSTAVSASDKLPATWGLLKSF